MATNGSADKTASNGAANGIGTAIILAAGEGTRMKSALPKVLHTLASKTFLRRIMESVGALSPEVTAVVVHHGRDAVAAEAQAVLSSVTIIDQDDLPGTGRAVWCAMDQIGSAAVESGKPVLITAADMPLLDSETLKALVTEHVSSGNSATVLTTILDDPFGYGRIVRDGAGNVERIVEERDATDEQRAIREVNTSVYVFDPAVLQASIRNLDTNNDQHEFYLTDALAYARSIGKVGTYAAPDSLAVQGVNDRVQLSRLAKAHNVRTCEKWMREGVDILDPQTTWIDDDVRIARDAQILPGCFLHGSTTVGEGAVVGPYTTLIDATVKAGAHVERARVQETEIGENANIGPWTYLRPGNVLAADTKAGSFVEMKKAVIDEGTKVPHLSYVGDSHIGPHTNIGGGTITANYDGKHKNHTEIGANVHVGAGNMFVAPVTVGDNVTTGAGSVVRHAVSSGSMVYSENTQHEVKNWLPKDER